MKEFFEIIAGIIIAVSSGFLVKYVLDHAVPKDIRPKGINKQLQKLWVSIQSEDLKKPGKWLGGLERLLSLSAVRTGHHEIVAGWHLKLLLSGKFGPAFSNSLKNPLSMKRLQKMISSNSAGSWVAE